MYEDVKQVFIVSARTVSELLDGVPDGSTSTRIVVRDDENSMQAISVIKFVLLFASHKHVIKEILWQIIFVKLKNDR